MPMCDWSSDVCSSDLSLLQSHQQQTLLVHCATTLLPSPAYSCGGGGVGVSGISVHVDSGSLHLQAESPVSLHQAFSETVCGIASQPGSTGELQPRGNPPAPGRESGVSARVPFFRGTASPFSRAAPSLQQGCVHIGEQLRKPSSWRSLRLPCSGVLAVDQSLNHV